MATVLVPLANGCEELEAVTMIDLLRRADISVVTASLSDTTIQASRGVSLIADTSLEEVLDRVFDMVLLPGGLPGADHLNADARIHQLITKTYQAGGAVGAICAAPKVLVTNGIAKGKTITCYPGSIPTEDYPAIQFTDNAIEIDQRIFTSRGPGTAMDFTLTVIEYLKGKPCRNEVELGLVR